MPDPTTVATVEVFGVHIRREDITAVYTADPDGWVDMPEARPRARCQAVPDDPAGANLIVYVLDDGTLLYDKSDVTIDLYEDDMFAPLRAENEARWAARDKAAGR